MIPWSLATALAAEPAPADPFVPLYAAEATSSSFLRSNWNKFTENYHPNYALDGDPATAWVEGVDGVGVGEWIGWQTSQVSAVHRVKLRVRNGYQKSAALLTANAAPSRVSIELRSSGAVVFRQTVDLKRTLDWQDVVLDPPSDVPLDEVRLQIDAVQPGSAYADTCLSEVEVYVDSDTRWNGPYERSKQAALRAWAADRAQAAAFFASQPREYPFAATHFAQGPTQALEGSAKAAFERELEEAVRLEQRLWATPSPWRRVDGSVPRTPDGLELPEALGRWLAPERTLFEAADEWRSRTEQGGEDQGWHVVTRLSNARVELAPDGVTLASGVFRVDVVSEERSTNHATSSWLLRFDAAGRVRWAMVRRDEDHPEGCESASETSVYELERDAAGRVAAVTRRSRTTCRGSWDVEPDAQGKLPTRVEDATTKFAP